MAAGIALRIQRVVLRKALLKLAPYFGSVLLQTAAAIEGGAKTMSKRTKTAKAETEVPVELAVALKKNKAAGKVFAEFSPGLQALVRRLDCRGEAGGGVDGGGETT